MTKINKISKINKRIFLENKAKINTKPHRKAVKANESDTFEFQTKKIKFYPEDEERMKNMSVKEQIEYIKKLKKQKRYTYEN